MPIVHWAADLAQGDCVAAGFKDDSFQRQNNAGTFNDNTVPWPVPTVPATAGRLGRMLSFTIPSGYRRYEVVPNHASLEAGDSAFFGLAVRFPTGFPFSFGDFQIFEQLHQASGSGSPPVAFEARSNGIRLTGGFGLITSGSATGAHDQQVVASPALDTWHSLVYQVQNFSTSPNVSTINVWWNGTQVLANFTLPCPTLKTDTTSGETGTYRKNGIYRSQDNATALTIEQAGHATGTSYAEVDPSTPLSVGSGRPGRWNLLPNPALAVNEAGWSAIVTSGTGTAARTAVTGMDKPWAYRYTQTAVGATRIESPRVPVTPGMAYSGTVQYRYSNAAADIALAALIFYNSSGGIAATSAYSLTQSVGGLAANVPGRLSTTRVAPAGAVSCCMGVYLFTDGASGTATFEATAARVEQSDDPNLTYADGGTASWSWLGTAGASTSRNPAGLDTARLNSVTNPYLAGATTGWVRWVYGGVNSGTIARTAVTGMDRGWAYRLTSSFAHDFALVSSPVAVTPGQWYSATAQARFSIVPTTLAGLVVIWLTSASAYLSETGLAEQSLMTAAAPYRSRTQVSAPASAAFAAVGFRWTTSTQTPTVEVTAARIEAGRDGSLAYADGDTTGWTWDGSAGVSASRSVPTAPVLPGVASSTESVVALASRQHVRLVGIATSELDSARPVGLLRGGGLVETLVDTFEAGYLDPRWTTT